MQSGEETSHSQAGFSGAQDRRFPFGSEPAPSIALRESPPWATAGVGPTVAVGRFIGNDAGPDGDYLSLASNSASMTSSPPFLLTSASGPGAG